MRANKLETALSRDRLCSLSGSTRYVYFHVEWVWVSLVASLPQPIIRIWGSREDKVQAVYYWLCFNGFLFDQVKTTDYQILCCKLRVKSTSEQSHELYDVILQYPQLTIKNKSTVSKKTPLFFAERGGLYVNWSGFTSTGQVSLVRSDGGIWNKFLLQIYIVNIARLLLGSSLATFLLLCCGCES